jgi:hypothetical protein
MTNRRNWQLAFVKQAQSDWEAYQRARQAASLQSHQGIKLLKYIEYSLLEFEKLFLS